MHFYMESLGCARNQVDSEIMVARLTDAGLQATDDPALAEVIVVNTCSFIESAADESVDTILALADFKKTGRCRRLIVAGCLPERYRKDTVRALPEVDCFLGTGAYESIAAIVTGGSQNVCLLPDPDSIDISTPVMRKSFTPHTAYLKIAEGCNRRCTYCIIPKLRGNQKSRPVETILSEADALIKDGVRELTLVAQETTAYGDDLVPQQDLAGLLGRLAELDQSIWIRFLYGHPESITPAVLQTVARHANLCSYFDLPIQHAADRILRRMGRRGTVDHLYRLFDTIRKTVRDAVLRTTVLVGFPGETDKDFQQLLDFIKAVQFDHLGAFVYSDADDLPSHRLDGHVAAGVAHERLEELMAIQQTISAGRLQRLVGQPLDVLIETGPQDGYWIGRTQYQAPEVDGCVQIRNSRHNRRNDSTPVLGQIITVTAVETLDYDIIAE